MTAARPGTGLLSTGLLSAGLPERCQDTARYRGLAPALALLGAEALPGLLPCGPAGHTVTDPATYAAAGRLWTDGTTAPRAAGRERVLATVDLPGGAVALAAAPVPTERAPDEQQRAAFALGLVRIRLGLSEALRTACLNHLGRRRSGDGYLLQQQLVKGALADAVAEHLEAAAVLAGAGPGDLEPAVLADLHTRITATDRDQVRLLGASGYLRDGHGMTAYVSELLAEAHTATAGGYQP
ncbi:hypothetical protein ACGFZP_17545 [Kitasatospora sp. NPDC048239]|uniref:hypothetical protein n=1 Tax=Kitasatospora sp. NPDC048239 TaxID=3364046 RepID=UPI00371F7BA7